MCVCVCVSIMCVEGYFCQHDRDIVLPQLVEKRKGHYLHDSWATNKMSPWRW